MEVWRKDKKDGKWYKFTKEEAEKAFGKTGIPIEFTDKNYRKFYEAP